MTNACLITRIGPSRDELPSCIRACAVALLLPRRPVRENFRVNGEVMGHGRLQSGQRVRALDSSRRGQRPPSCWSWQRRISDPRIAKSKSWENPRRSG